MRLSALSCPLYGLVVRVGRGYPRMAAGPTACSAAPGERAAPAASARGRVGGAARSDRAALRGAGAGRTAIGDLDAALADVGVRREQLADEHHAVPPDAPVREAHTVAAAERRRRGELREQRAGASPFAGSGRRSWTPPSCAPMSSPEETSACPPSLAGSPTSRPGWTRTGWRSPACGRPPRDRKEQPRPRTRPWRNWAKAAGAWRRRPKRRRRRGRRRRPLRRCTRRSGDRRGGGGGAVPAA